VLQELNYAHYDMARMLLIVGEGGLVVHGANDRYNVMELLNHSFCYLVESVIKRSWKQKGVKGRHGDRIFHLVKHCEDCDVPIQIKILDYHVFG
jgi:hypothetical protein